MEIQDLLLNPPEDQPFEKLTEYLISRIADSEREKLQQLFTAEKLGDRKPSQWLRKMPLLLGEKQKLLTVRFYANCFCNDSQLMFG